jgi:hypothetical protein
MIQVLTLGIIPYIDALEIGIVMAIGTYLVSKLIFETLRRVNRLSIIMWTLVYFPINAIILLAF